MAKQKSSTEVNDILRPLLSNKRIVSYLITRNIDKGHNKVYIFVVHKTPTHNSLARFWGRFGATTLSHSVTEYDLKTYQKLLNEKASKGYKLVTDEELLKNRIVYNDICTQISRAL